MLSFINATFRVFGDYLHLTRQHWISSLSLILPGNDDDRRLQASAGGKNRTLLSAKACMWNRPWISNRSSTQESSYLAVLDCTTVVLTLSGNDVFWVSPRSALWL